jgi:hypothetical protein
MSRFILVAMMVAVTVAGCNRFPDNGLQIAANLPPDSSCQVSADQDVRLLRGIYDISLTSDYTVVLLLQNYIISNALEFQGEQANIQVDNYDITLLLPDGSALPVPDGVANPYRVDTNAVLPAAEGTNIPQEVGAATGIPAGYQDLIQAALASTGYSSVLLEIRAGGTTFGGFSQRSAPFRWPVDICEGCLQDCLNEDLDSSCLPGQDIWPWCPIPVGGTGGTGGAGGAGGTGGAP